MTIEFKGWPKTPRLFRDITITEKIDGSNAAVIIQPVPEGLGERALDIGHDEAMREYGGFAIYANEAGEEFLVGAQSRKRLIFPGDDNFAFAFWVNEHAADLVEILGVGYHYGEWWGSGIQRGYGLAKGEKRFSLFNVHRYGYVSEHPLAYDGTLSLSVVPTLYIGPFSEEDVYVALGRLFTEGSKAAPGFTHPEGVVVYHSASKQVYKVLIENDDTPKSVLGRT